MVNYETFEPVEYSYFQPCEVPEHYVKALAEMTLECAARGITFKTRFYQGGFQCYQFSCSPERGDVVIHDNSYGHYTGEWEAFQFPWTYISEESLDDVAVMTTVEFVDKLCEYYHL